MTYYFCPQSQMRLACFILLTSKCRLTTRSTAQLVTERNLADVCDRMVLISVDSLWNCEYGSDLVKFPALAIFPSSTSWCRVTVFRAQGAFRAEMSEQRFAARCTVSCSTEKLAEKLLSPLFIYLGEKSY
jgi:hypothetical protein